MTRHRVRGGMTLLEVVIALAIAGSALASGAAVLGFLTDQQARAGTQSVVSAHAVRGTIRAWTSQARLATEGDAEFRGLLSDGPTVARTGARADELSFVTTTPTQVSESGTLVRLYLASGDSAAQRGLMAELQPWRHAGASATVSLAPNAVGLRVRYLSSLFGQRSWLDRWVSTSVLPAAVELRIVYDSTNATSEDRAARSLLATPMLIPLAGRP